MIFMQKKQNKPKLAVAVMVGTINSGRHLDRSVKRTTITQLREMEGPIIISD
jgi:hypothetical protein